jgi:transcriptional regulator NrdR family protein
MIRCPKCKEICITSGSSRYIEDQNIYVRGRKCPVCNYKFKTVELDKQSYNDAIALSEGIGSLIKRFVMSDNKNSDV